MTMYKATHDPDAEDPRGDFEYPYGPEIWTYQAGDIHSKDAATRFDHPGAYAFFTYRDRGLDDERALALAQRYASVFHESLDVLSLHSLTGYTQGDWAYVLAVCPPDLAAVVASYVREYEMWWRGDVYVVTEYAEETCDLGYKHEEAVNQLFGILAEDEDDAIAQYKEQMK